MAYRSFLEQALHYFMRPQEGMPEGPVRSPADWRGAEMSRAPERWTTVLAPGEIAELRAAVDRVRAAGLAMGEVTRESFPLPALSERVRAWRRAAAEGLGFVLVRGLPVEAWGDEDAALAYWGLGHHLGVPGAQNARDELLGHVVDYGEKQTDPMARLYRTTANIGFHCDAADAVGLLCLRTAREGGESRIASSVAVYNEILRREPALARRLFEPFMLDRRGEEPPGEPGWVPMHAACWGGGVLRTFYHGEYFRSAARFAEGGRLDGAAEAALDLYDAIAGSPEFRLDMRLAPGDMQFISNHAIVHARTEYRDHPEPERKRHLLRLWLSLE